MSKPIQTELPMEHKIECPMCHTEFPEADVHPDDQLCGPCEVIWVNGYEELLK